MQLDLGGRGKGGPRTSPVVWSDDRPYGEQFCLTDEADSLRRLGNSST